jgi:hypothetical protein
MNCQKKTLYINKSYFSISKIKDVARKSTNDNDDTYCNRAPNDNGQRTKGTAGKSDFLGIKRKFVYIVAPIEIFLLL